jgi:hypothetical protein
MASSPSEPRLVVCAGALLLVSSGCAAAPQPSTAAPPVAPPVAEAPDAVATTALAAPTESEPSAQLEPLPPPAAPAEPAPPPARSALLVDELPYYPVHLRAHDVAPERHRPRRSSRAADERAASRRPYHPAPGVIVDVVSAEGGVPAADLQRIARNLGYWPFRQCYEEGLRKDQRLRGKVSLDLVVHPTGAVDASAVAATTVRDEIVAACVAREARHLAFSSGESPTTAKIDVSLALGDEPVLTARPLPNAAPLRDALRESWDAVRTCYANELATHSDAGGRMELYFHVRHGVDVVDVDEGDSRFGDVDVTRCVLGIYRTTKLPEVYRAHEGHFVYALHFESKPVEAVVSP